MNARSCRRWSDNVSGSTVAVIFHTSTLSTEQQTLQTSTDNTTPHHGHRFSLSLQSLQQMQTRAHPLSEPGQSGVITHLMSEELVQHPDHAGALVIADAVEDLVHLGRVADGDLDRVRCPAGRARDPVTDADLDEAGPPTETDNIWSLVTISSPDRAQGPTRSQRTASTRRIARFLTEAGRNTTKRDPSRASELVMYSYTNRGSRTEAAPPTLPRRPPPVRR